MGDTDEAIKVGQNMLAAFLKTQRKARPYAPVTEQRGDWIDAVSLMLRVLENQQAELARLQFAPLPSTPTPGEWPWDGEEVLLWNGTMMTTASYGERQWLPDYEDFLDDGPPTHYAAPPKPPEGEHDQA